MYNEHAEAEIVLSGIALCQAMRLTLQDSIWDGVDQPLCASRIKRYRALGQTLKPEAGLMGGELRTLRQHEQRIAWLMDCDPAHWQPLHADAIMSCEDGYAITLADGHHRLIASSLLNCHVCVGISFGDLQAVNSLLADTGGQWLTKPTQATFGHGVFPCASDKRQYVRVRCAFGKIWIDDIDTGFCLARYGAWLWSVGDNDGIHDLPPAFGMRNHETEEEHMASFAQACARSLGVAESLLLDHLRDSVPVSPFRQAS